MSMDVETNESPLLTASDHNGTGNTTRQNLLGLILFFRSTELFIAGARAPAAAASRSPSLSRVSSSLTSYSVLSGTDAKDGLVPNHLYL